jgi:ferric-dicitrate binding protein FerR (iron transport regulator)
MNLTDQDILELNELCNSLVDGTLSAAQKSRLAHWLESSEDARRFYVRAMGLSASLFSYASEMQTAEPEAPVPLPLLFRGGWRQWWPFGAVAAAASIALLLWFAMPQQKAAVTAPTIIATVAHLTGVKDCEWLDNAAAVSPGEQLHKGQRLELAKGFAEVTFDSGARVVLQGPASLEVSSAWAARLNSGSLKASVPQQAVGFSISNPNVEVVDLGTEFTMSADANGSAEVLVLKGEVEAAPTAAPSHQPILLAAKESRRFESTGVSAASDAGEKFAQLTRPLALDHFNLPTDYTHWSFDETNGTLFHADISGRPAGESALQLEFSPHGTGAATHIRGRWGEGLQFDGSFFAKALVPGLSDYTPHTIAFWVKVPKDAKLSSAYAMVAWGVNNEKLGTHPIHISWNRNPAEGPVGVLRTDYGGGFALGSTSLRDGQWRHIAVEFIPTDDADKTVEVKQYVDGRLEGEGHASPPGSDIFKRISTKKNLAMNDIVWLGSRLGVNDVRAERFCGEMDELFIANEAFEPLQIVQLMNDNRLEVELAANDESE